MKRIYEEAGLSTSSMNSRISTMNGSLSKEEQEAITLAVAEKIEEIVLTLEIPPGQVANALGLTWPPGEEGFAVWPCAYLEGPDGKRPIYLPKDKIQRRDAATGSGEPLFWKRDRITEAIVKNAKVHPTERGKSLFDVKQI